MWYLNKLQEIFSDSTQISMDSETLAKHSHDLTSYHKPVNPDVVIFPNNKYELSKVIAFANNNQIPLVPYGLGTSVEGQIIPVKGGITINLSRMNKISEVNENDLIARVQPGVTRLELNEYLKKKGLFFPIDPGVNATIGGMAATNASGCSAVKYGAMKNQVLGLEVILSNGEIIKTGNFAQKSSSGYNLTQLFIGSEGTLGFFTELIIKLQPIPQSILLGKAIFPDIESACKVAQEIKMKSLQIAKLELVDENTIMAVNRYKKTNFKCKPTLFIELAGNNIENDLKMLEDILYKQKCLEFESETNVNLRDEVWSARREVALALSSADKNKKVMTTDVCVPISVMPEAISHTKKLIEQYKVEGYILGHVGDGNYHAAFIVDSTDMDIFNKLNEKIVKYSISNGGTCSGEHGIGLGKRKYLQLEHGNSSEIMHNIKKQFDPNNILNPGKIFIY
ncbi:FAD-binding oxidoreductase (plasmid) [Bacillus mycoides]|uniref:FAD-binding oxidoreductase n=1 Tax=Bacillus mycoides TaxID=1405 RepID=UPI003F751A9F